MVMTLWLLIVTVHFTFLDRGMTLDLPAETIFQSQDRCLRAGAQVADSLTQDGTKVEWHCVGVNQ